MTTPSLAGTSLFALRARWQELVREQPAALLRIHLLASYTIDPLVPYAGVELHDAGLPAAFTVGTANQIVQQLLDGGGEVDGLRPDVLVVAPRFEELDGAPSTPAADWALELRRIVDVAVATARRQDCCLVVVLPAIPERRLHGVADVASLDGVVAAATLAREQLRRRLSTEPGVLVADAEQALRSVGGRHAHHPALFRLAKVPYTEEVFASVGAQLGRLLRCRYGCGRRLAVLDLDSMLSAGREPAQALRAATAELRGAGLLLAARASQDDETWRSLAALGDLLLDLLGACALDGRPVVEQLERLARDAGVPLAQTVLATCDPVLADDFAERSEAEVVVLADDPDSWLQRLGDAGLLDRAPDVALGDVGEPVAAHEDGLDAPDAATRETETLSLSDYVASLEVAVSYEPVSDADVPAITELVERAKDFTLGIRHAAPELAARAGQLVAVAVRDRFGDHGISAVVALRPSGGTCTVDLFSMSCAVLGRNVEDAVVEEIVARATRSGCDSVVFRHAPTPHNGPAQRFIHAATTREWLDASGRRVEVRAERETAVGA
jgi:FkbH-like protein